MKKTLLLALFAVSFTNLIAQEAVSYSKVVQVDSTDKAKLFAMVHEWFASTYNSANDVIQMSDKEAGILVGKGAMTYSYGKVSYVCYDGKVDYTIKVSVKDNRFKIELSNFIHSINPGNGAQCNLGLITTAEVYTTSGMSKNYSNKAWVDIKEKINSYSNGVISD